MSKRSMTTGVKAALLAACASAILAGSALPTCAATAEQQKSEKFYREAVDALKKKDGINAAIIQLKNALKADPGNVSARLLLADIYLRLGQGAYAEKELKAAEQRGAPFSDIMIDLGRSLMQQGRFEDVLKEITLDKATDANRADVLIVRGQAELGLRRFDAAEEAFREAHKIKPGEARSLVGLSQTLASRGRIKESEEMADQALATSPDLIDAQVLKGELRRLNRDLEGAITWFAKAIEQRPTHTAARLGRAASLVDLNRDAEAEPDLKAVLQVMPKHPMVRYLQALTLAKKKDYVGAKDALLDAGPALDDHLPSMFLRGAVSYALGEHEQAQSNLARYLAQIPQNTRARKLLAATYVRSNQGARAIEVLKPIENVGDLDPQTLALLGSAYMQQGNLSKGTEFFQKAAEEAPDQADIRTRLAISRLAQGQADRAEGDLEVALELDKDASQAGILLSLVRLRKGEFDEAIQSAEALQKSMPGSPLPHNLLGAAYLGKGDTVKAREMFSSALKQKPDFNPARMNLAQLDLRENKLDSARNEYNAILKNDNRNVAALMGLANVALAEKNGDQAVQWLTRAADAEPRNIQPKLRLIGYYSEAGNPQKALATARDLSAVAPDNPQVLEVLGRAEVAAGNSAGAKSTFKRLTEVQPKSGRAQTLYASAQVLTNDLPGARVSLQKAIDLDDQSIPAYIAMVELDLRAENYDAAMKTAEALKKKQPKLAAGDMLRGDIMLAQKKYDDAVKAYEAAQKLEDTPVLAIRRFAAERRGGKKDAAYAALEKWVGGTDDKVGRNTLATTYLVDKDYKKAIEHTEKLLSSEKDNPVLLNNAAWAYQQMGDKRAKEYAERAHAIAPQSPAVMDTLGWILVQTDDPNRGLDLLKRAASAAPNQGDIRYHVAAGLQKLGRTEEALRELQRLLAAREGEIVNFSTKAEAETLLKQLGG
jgi:putative PEP-CTERM system TPR-repeat lipoprotein